jgi:hypothetical protein
MIGHRRSEVLYFRVDDPDASRVLSDPVVRLNRTAITLRAWALVLLVCVVACASPATTTRDTPVAG